MRKSIRIRAVIAAAAVVTGAVGVALPAVAQAGNAGYCSGSWVCVYKNSNFSIGLGYRAAGFGLTNISAANNNEVSSWENRTGTGARWYTEGGGSGLCHSMARYSELSWMGFGQNDNMSSWSGTRTC